jgi:polysaccharide deacetylase 2 family uncharacterized protein YibQ
MASTQDRKRESGFSRFVARLLLFVTWFFPVCFAFFFGYLLHKAYARLGPRSEGVIEASSTRMESSGQSSRIAGTGARVAIVIDDLGLDMESAETLFNMEIPVTLSVLPYRKYSLEVAKKAFQKGKEVLLHLPLQPYDYPMTDPGAGCLLVSMNREKIQQEVQDQIDSLPHCVGVHSHMGSLFEEMQGPVTYLVSVLKERDLFLVDNGTSAGSRVVEVARNCGVSFVQRTHFLDERREEGYVIQQLCRLADFASANGWAVGVGHPYPETLAALPRALAAFQEKNVTLVPVSGLLASRQTAPMKSAWIFPGPGEGSDELVREGENGKGRADPLAKRSRPES